jgi:hypothetical protein
MARPSSGQEELVAQGIVGGAGGEPALVLHAHVHGEVRQAVRVVGGAVERVDDEAQAPAAARGARLLGQHRRAREAPAQELEQRRLARPIRVGDEVDVAPLELDGAAAPEGGAQHLAAPPRRLAARLHELPRLGHVPPSSAPNIDRSGQVRIPSPGGRGPG